LRNEGLGVTFFRSKFLTDNIKGIYTFTKDFNQYPALIPPMSWTRKQAPIPVRVLHIQRGATIDQLSWLGARDNSGADYLLYNVYASEDYPVDTKDARNLIATRYRNQSLAVPHRGRSLNYAVTVTDRYGNESMPKETQATVRKDRKPIDFRQLIIGNPQKYKKKRK